MPDRKNEWDIFIWTAVGHNATARGHSGDMPKAFRKVPTYLVHLPDSWEKYRSGLSRNMRKAIRKGYQPFAEDGYSFSFRAVARPDDIRTSLDRLLALHSERARCKDGIKHRDLFAKVSHRAFIADVAKLIAERDQLRIFELEIDGKIVASRMGFLLGNELSLYYSGYDLTWRKHGIMTTLMCECFKWATEHGVSVANLSKGRDPSKCGGEVVRLPTTTLS